MPSSVVGGAARRKAALNGNAVRPVVGPGAARLDELAGGDRGRGADHGHQVALAAHLDPQDAEAGLFTVEGDAFNRAGLVFRWGVMS